MRPETHMHRWLRCAVLLWLCWAGGLSTLQAATLVAEWRFDENSWVDSPGQARNSASATLMHGWPKNGASTLTANPNPARTGDPGTCRYGSFDGADDFVEIAHASSLNLTSRVAISAWVYPRSYGTSLRTIVSKENNYGLHLNASGQVVATWNSGRQTVSTATVPLNQWTHIIAFYQSGAQSIYIDGVAVTTSALTGALTGNTLPLQIGQNHSGTDRFWDGLIDDVRVYSTILTAAEAQAAYQASHSCATSAGYFVISHDGAGVNCAVERVRVSVFDMNGSPIDGYSQTVTLTTQSARGTWTRLADGASDSTPNDGVAAFQWPAGSATAEFSLSYPEGPQTIDIDAFQSGNTALRDDDTEGAMTFAASQLVVTSSALATNQSAPLPSFAASQEAGTAFDIHIAKFGEMPNSAGCGIVTDYTGTKSLSIWSSYLDPSMGSRALSVTSSAGTVNVSTNEGTTRLNVVFANGQAQIRGQYRDVGRISFSLRDNTEATATPSVLTRGGSGSFVVKPAYFSVTASGNTAPSTATGTVYRAAGDPFTVTVTARESGGLATPNFGKESAPHGVVLVPTVAAPSGGVDGEITGTFGAFNNGSATSTNTAWSEVGIVRFTGRIKDGDYLGAGDIQGVASGNIGRFKPADFRVEMVAGQVRPGCNTFSYLGQPLKYADNLVLRVTARNRSGVTTQNYRTDFFKLSNGSLRSPTGTTTTPLDLVNAYSLLDNTRVTQQSSPAPAWLPEDNGVATLTFATGTGTQDGLVIEKRVPRATFDALLQLRFRLYDTDNVTTASDQMPVVIGADTGIPFTDTTLRQQRYGRLTFRNAVGSERINLPLPLRVEYYLDDASGFVPDTDVTCPIDPALTFTEYPGRLQASETGIFSMRAAPVQGNFDLVLRAPGAGNDGRIRVDANVPLWLQSWNATDGTYSNPWGMATFGLFQGNGRRVYQREVYSGAP